MAGRGCAHVSPYREVLHGPFCELTDVRALCLVVYVSKNVRCYHTTEPWLMLLWKCLRERKKGGFVF